MTTRRTTQDTLLEEASALGSLPVQISDSLHQVLVDIQTTGLEARRVEMVAFHQSCNKLSRWIQALSQALDSLDHVVRRKIIAVDRRVKVLASVNKRNVTQGTAEANHEPVADDDEAGQKVNKYLNNAANFMYRMSAVVHSTEQDLESCQAKERSATDNALRCHTQAVQEAEAVCAALKQASKKLVVRWMQFEKNEAIVLSDSINVAISSSKLATAVLRNNPKPLSPVILTAMQRSCARI